MNGFREVRPEELDANFFDAIGREWMLVSTGDRERYNTMTASWGGVGVLWGRPVAFVFIRPQRFSHALAESGGRMTLSFPGEAYRAALTYCGAHSGRDGDKFSATGLEPVFTEAGTPAIAQARLIVEGTKLYADPIREEAFVDRSVAEQWYPRRDFHTMYVLGIDHVWIKA